MSTSELTVNPAEAESGQLERQRPIVLIIGGVIGALIGVFGAYLLLQNAERKGKQPRVSAGEGVRLAVLVAGLLRTVADL